MSELKWESGLKWDIPEGEDRFIITRDEVNIVRSEVSKLRKENERLKEQLMNADECIRDVAYQISDYDTILPYAYIEKYPKSFKSTKGGE